MAMLPTMLEEDRRRAGWSVGQAAWRIGVSVREYREIGAGKRCRASRLWTGSAAWLTAVTQGYHRVMEARLDSDQVNALRSWLDRHAGHEVVVTEDSDEPVVGIIFDCEDDGEEIYLGSFESAL